MESDKGNRKKGEWERGKEREREEDEGKNFHKLSAHSLTNCRIGRSNTGVFSIAAEGGPIQGGIPTAGTRAVIDPAHRHQNQQRDV